MSGWEASAAGHALRTVIGASCLLTLVVFWVWWVHGDRGPKVMTREIGGIAVLLGLVGLFVDAAAGVAVMAFGIALWVLAGRLGRSRPLDDTAVMGRSAAGSDDDEDDG